MKRIKDDPSLFLEPELELDFFEADMLDVDLDQEMLRDIYQGRGRRQRWTDE